MKQYLDLLQKILDEGTYKPAARANMPGSISLFGPQMEFDLSKGFPILNTKKVSFKNIVGELIWFLKGDSNLKYLVDNGINIWNEDAYHYYLKQIKKANDEYLLGNNKHEAMTYESFVNKIKTEDIGELEYDSYLPHYTFGDTGYQYPKVWRDWNNGEEFDYSSTDQINNVITGLINNPEGRRHIVTAIDPVNDTNLALYWCHCMFQFNARPLTDAERLNISEVRYGTSSELGGYKIDSVGDAYYTLKPEILLKLDEEGIPKYYLDCKMYQRSADMFLGVPYNISSYALLTEIVAKLTGMIPGKYIHTFGDAHIYDTHMDAVKEQLSRTPSEEPVNLYWNTEASFENKPSFDDFIGGFEIDDVGLGNYNPQPAIKGKLSTGL